MGGGSELALCADLVIASDDARFGTPYSRVWGCHLTGMWVHRLGLAKAKYYALTGEWISGKEAAAVELINFSYPLEELDQRVEKLAKKLTTIPLTQPSAKGPRFEQSRPPIPLPSRHGRSPSHGR